MISKQLILQAVLDKYGILGKVVEEKIVDGKVEYKVIRQPDRAGYSLKKHAKSIARHLGVENMQISKLPEINAYSILIPYKYVNQVNFDEIVNSHEFMNTESVLPMIVGKDPLGRTLIDDITKMPHLLLGGTSDYRRCIFIDSIILSILHKFSCNDVKLILMSPDTGVRKNPLSLTDYDGISHLAYPVISDTKEAFKALDFLCTLVKQTIGFDGKRQKMPYTIVIIDEFADMMKSNKNEFEKAISFLGKKARAAGVQLVLSTQVLKNHIITDTIKTYFPSRVAFKTQDANCSRLILDRSGAEYLLGGGDMMYLPISSPHPLRVQCPYVPMQKIKTYVDNARKVITPPDSLGMSKSMNKVQWGGLL